MSLHLKLRGLASNQQPTTTCCSLQSKHFLTLSTCLRGGLLRGHDLHPGQLLRHASRLPPWHRGEQEAGAGVLQVPHPRVQTHPGVPDPGNNNTAAAAAEVQWDQEQATPSTATTITDQAESARTTRCGKLNSEDFPYIKKTWKNLFILRQQCSVT